MNHGSGGLCLHFQCIPCVFLQWIVSGLVRSGLILAESAILAIHRFFVPGPDVAIRGSTGGTRK